MKKILKEIIPYIIILIVVLLIKHFLVAPVRVIGDSMYSTLKNNDIMIENKLSYRFNKIKRFDIVVVKYDNTLIIKRIIGLPGDEIKYKDNKLFINGKYYSEKYLDKGTKTLDFDLDKLFGVQKVPKNCYFVLGDNRKVSKDSRIIGFVNKKDITGKADLTIFPFSRIGIKK